MFKATPDRQIQAFLAGKDSEHLARFSNARYMSNVLIRWTCSAATQPLIIYRS
jgi:hypothetical protein